MPSKSSPSRTEFIVKGTGADAIADRLGSRGSVESVGGDSDLVLVRLRTATGNARDSWRQAQEAVGAKTTLQPVFVDADGQAQYPTGEVSVRFHKAVSKADLDRFAAKHDLRILRRNEFVPDQVVFEPVEDSRYLPDVIEELEASGETRMAWPNTIGTYRRKDSDTT